MISDHHNESDGDKLDTPLEKALHHLEEADLDRADARVLRAQADALDAAAVSQTLEAECDLEKINKVRITVNTTDAEEPRGMITYLRVVEIGYRDYGNYPKATYSIVYERGPKSNPEGTLSKGGSVFITEGMRFRVKRTGES